MRRSITLDEKLGRLPAGVRSILSLVADENVTTTANAAATTMSLVADENVTTTENAAATTAAPATTTVEVAETTADISTELSTSTATAAELDTTSTLSTTPEAPGTTAKATIKGFLRVASSVGFQGLGNESRQASSSGFMASFKESIRKAIADAAAIAPDNVNVNATLKSDSVAVTYSITGELAVNDATTRALTQAVNDGTLSSNLVQRLSAIQGISSAMEGGTLTVIDTQPPEGTGSAEWTWWDQ
jgi:hypothetical protein